MRMNRYIGANSVLYVAIDVISICLVFFFIIQQVQGLRKLGLAYFQNTWTLIDFILLLVCIVEIIFYTIKYVVNMFFLSRVEKFPDRFINFQWVGFWDEMNQFMMGVMVFIFTIRFLKLLSFNRKVNMLGHVLGKAGIPLLNFALVFIIVFMAFAQMGYLMFHTNVVAFKNIQTCIETLGVMTLSRWYLVKW